VHTHVPFEATITNNTLQYVDKVIIPPPLQHFLDQTPAWMHYIFALSPP
jgi:hypothetical protein